MIIQWGSSKTNNGTIANIAFPIGFPNACLSVTGTLINSTKGDSLNVRSMIKTSFGAITITPNGEWVGVNFTWMAIGY